MINDDSDLDATVKELTSEDKALMVSNSNNFFRNVSQDSDETTL